MKENNSMLKNISDDNNETAVELVGITKTIAFYGIADLKDILLLIKENGYSAKLSECRPGKVILYLQVSRYISKYNSQRFAYMYIFLIMHQFSKLSNRIQILSGQI